MAYDSPRQLQRRQALAALLAEPEINGPANLARLLEMPSMKTHLSAIMAGRRGIGDKLAARIESAANKSPGWLDRYTSSVGENVAPYAVAQNLSHLRVSDAVPLLTVEELMVLDDAPAAFRMLLTDDALAPDLPKGTEVVWSTKRQVQPGRYVLLADAHGQLHARMCQQGRAPGHWLARPLSSAYVTFDSAEPGLRVVAVYKGRMEPDDIP